MIPLRAFFTGLLVVAVPVAALVSLGAVGEWNAEATGHPEHAAHPDAGAPYLQQAVIEQARFHRFGSYIEASNTVNAVRYIEAVKAAEAEAARARRVVHRSAPRRSASHITGACTGFSVPDYIIQRESRGDPNAYNSSSGAIGCTQTLMSHYTRGQCQGLDPHTVDGQRECTRRLSNNGTNLQPWST